MNVWIRIGAMLISMCCFSAFQMECVAQLVQHLPRCFCWLSGELEVGGSIPGRGSNKRFTSLLPNIHRLGMDSKMVQVARCKHCDQCVCGSDEVETLPSKAYSELAGSALEITLNAVHKKSRPYTDHTYTGTKMIARRCTAVTRHQWW